MKKEERLIVTLNISDLKEIIRETMTELLVELNNSQIKDIKSEENQLITRKEVAEIFQVTSCGAGSNFLEDIKSMLNMIEIS